MNIQYLRASSIKTYEGCQFQFFLESILQIPSGSGKKALLGTIVHHVLEIMAKANRFTTLFWNSAQEENFLILLPSQELSKSPSLDTISSN